MAGLSVKSVPRPTLLRMAHVFPVLPMQEWPFSMAHVLLVLSITGFKMDIAKIVGLNITVDLNIRDVDIRVSFDIVIEGLLPVYDDVFLSNFFFQNKSYSGQLFQQKRAKQQNGRHMCTLHHALKSNPRAFVFFLTGG